MLLQINEKDGYPQKICMICQESAIKSYTFRLKCEQSDNFLITKGIKIEAEDDLSKMEMKEEEQENFENIIIQ